MTLPRAVRAPRPSMDGSAALPPDRQDEGGIVLVLSLLVMMVLVVVVTQVFHTSIVDLRRAENEAVSMQMELLARAAMRKAEASLLLDLTEDTEEAQQDENDPDAGGGVGTGALGGAGGAAGGQATTARADSLDEMWASGDIPFELGDLADLETRIYIEDEDSKINLNLLAVQDDPEYREEWRQRILRALDILRDGQQKDLDDQQAREILERVEKWLRGEREFEEITTAPLADGPVEDGETGQEFYPPLSLAELSMVGGIPPSLLYGFAVGEPGDREWVPGITRVLTVLSNLQFDEDAAAAEDPDDPDATGGAGAGGAGAGGAAGGTSGAAGGQDTGTDDESADEPPEPAVGVNNGRINVNTAPLPVLRALFSEDEIPASAWEEYDEFRRDRLEELLEDPFGEEESDLGAGFGDEEGMVYPLAAVEELRRFDGFSEANGYLDPETWKKLQSILSVESNVFTITVVVATRYQPTQYFVARSVVWRRNANDGPEIIPVLPFERLPDSAVDLSRLEEELEEFSGWQYQ